MVFEDTRDSVEQVTGQQRVRSKQTCAVAACHGQTLLLVILQSYGYTSIQSDPGDICRYIYILFNVVQLSR